MRLEERRYVPALVLKRPRWLRSRLPLAAELAHLWQAVELGARVRVDQRELGPRDMIDIQSFLWVQGSGEYDE